MFFVISKGEAMDIAMGYRIKKCNRNHILLAHNWKKDAQRTKHI
jgi:hypothetical protein